jgi:hypothetical protein
MEKMAQSDFPFQAQIYSGPFSLAVLLHVGYVETGDPVAFGHGHPP